MRGFAVVALICIAIALIYQAGGCQKDFSDCTRDVTNSRWICPE